MTIRKQILEAMKAAAMRAPSLNGRVERSRTTAIARNESTVGVIRPSAEGVEARGGIAERDFIVEFIVIARGGVPDDIADEVIDEVHAEFCADPSFGGLAAQLFEQGSNWDFVDADQAACELTARYRVRYYTPEDSLTNPI